MTSCVFERYVSEMPHIHAERMLDGAQIAVYPHMKKSDSRSWWRNWQRRAISSAQRLRNSVLTFNGRKVTRDGLRSIFGGVGGVEIDAEDGEKAA